MENPEVIAALLTVAPGTYAVENFEVMEAAIPGFAEIYRGRAPGVFPVASISGQYVRLLLPGGEEWHRRDHYTIIKIDRL